MDTKSEQGDTDCAKRVIRNKHGLPVTKAGRISIKNMEISQQISSTRPYEGALSLFGFNLIFGQAYSLFTMVKCGPFMPVEMNRDDKLRKQIFASASPHALGPEQIKLYNESAVVVQNATNARGLVQSVSTEEVFFLLFCLF